MTNTDYLPNLFILGAAKAGTTALFEILKQHPDIYCTIVKEPLFFSNDEAFSKGLGWYSSTYFRDSSDFSLRCEASPHYLYWAEKTASRLNALPNKASLKFIICLREPASRAYSWYWNMIKENLEHLPFGEAVAKEKERIRKAYEDLSYQGAMTYGYIKGSTYLEQIKIYLAHFNREQFFFLKQNSIHQPNGTEFRPILDFLKIDNAFTFTKVKANPPRLPINRRFHNFLHNKSFSKDLIKRFIPHEHRYRLKQKLRELNLRDFSYPPMEQRNKKNIQDIFRTQIPELEKITGLDLSDWKF